MAVGGGRNLECRMYEARKPEEGMVVMVEVNRVSSGGFWVNLLEYNNLVGFVPLSEIRRHQPDRPYPHKADSLSKIGRIKPVRVVQLQESRIRLSKKSHCHVSREASNDHFFKSNLVHSILRGVSLAINMDLEELYIRIGWPLYRKYGHAFEALNLILNDPNSVLDPLTYQFIVTGADCHEVTTLVPSVTPQIKDVLVTNIRRFFPLPEPLMFFAFVEIHFRLPTDPLFFQNHLRRAETVGTYDCRVKIKAVDPRFYYLTAHTLDENQGISTLDAAITIFDELVKFYSYGTLVVKEAPRALRENEDILLERMANLRLGHEQSR